MEDTTKSNLKNKFAVISVWFPFANFFFILITASLESLVLSMVTNSTVANAYMGLYYLVGFWGITVNMKHAVSYGFKSDNRREIATLGILLSIAAYITHLISAAICFMNSRNSLTFNDGLAIFLFTVFTIWLYKFFIDRIFKGKISKPAAADTPIMNRRVGGNAMHEVMSEARQEAKGEIQYYYNIGDSNDRKLVSFEQIRGRIYELKKAYDEKRDTHDCILNVWANQGIGAFDRISALHNLEKKMFSKKIKANEYWIELHVFDGSDMDLYSYFTEDFEELLSMFYEFVVNQKAPDIKNFHSNYFRH